jgi:exonuclease VII small subunit
MKGITQKVYENKQFNKKCQNVIENARESVQKAVTSDETQSPKS